MYTFDRRKVYMWFFLRFAPKSQSAQRKRRTQSPLHTYPEREKPLPDQLLFPSPTTVGSPVGREKRHLTRYVLDNPLLTSLFKGRNCKGKPPFSRDGIVRRSLHFLETLRE